MAWMEPECGPTVLFGLHDDAQPHQVVDLGELLAPHHHLLVDAPQVLGATGDVGLDPRRAEAFAHRHQHGGEIVIAFGRPGGHHLLDLGVALGVQGGEGQVLELPLELLDPEAVRERRVDVEGLLGGAALLPFRHHRHRAHVVEPVGELDDEDAPVRRHGHEHLAHRGGLLGLLGVELQAVELGHPVDDGAHLGSELLGDVLEGEPGVLHRVVEQGRGHRPGVEAQFGDDGGHGHGVGDVGLAGLAQLALVGLLGDLAGPDDQLAVDRGRPGPAGVVGGQHAPHQVVEHRRAAERGSQTLDGDHLLTVPARSCHGAPPGRRRWRCTRAQRRLPPFFGPLPLRGRGGGRPEPDGRGPPPVPFDRLVPPGRAAPLLARGVGRVSASSSSTSTSSSAGCGRRLAAPGFKTPDWRRAAASRPRWPTRRAPRWAIRPALHRATRPETGRQPGAE